MIQFTIPGRPSAWQRHIEFVDKRTHRIVKKTPGDMKAAQEEIALRCRIAMKGQQPLSGAVRLEVLAVYAVPPSWSKAKLKLGQLGRIWKACVPDLDNIGKQIADALNGVAYKDDCQIVQTSMGKRYGQPERTEVRVIPLLVLDDRSSTDAYNRALEAVEGQDTIPGLP